LRAAVPAGFGVLLIDTPPSLSDTIAEVLALADLAVIPVRPSPNDLRALVARSSWQRQPVSRWCS